MSNIIILAAIILYLGMVVWIGVICSKKNSDVGDFYLGGRKLGPVVTAMSAEASDMSSYLLMGVPGLAYLTGLADATWTAIGLGATTFSSTWTSIDIKETSIVTKAAYQRKPFFLYPINKCTCREVSICNYEG